MAQGGLGNRRLVTRAGLALVLTNVRYWTGVAPRVSSELSRWQLQAEAIDDPELRALALEKLHGEGFHAEAAAMLATLAPRAHRATVIEAIVALEVLFDYLDGLTELPSRDPLREGDRLFRALIDAVAIPSPLTTESVDPPLRNDGGYLEALCRAVSTGVARLPAAAAVADVALRTAERSAQAQIRAHAGPQLGTRQLEEWARTEAEGTGLGWRELVVGAASSVLVLHALIVAAADPRTTPTQAAQITAAYLSMCVPLTLLDGLVDHEHDALADGSVPLGYLSLFPDRAELPDVLGHAARRAATQARGLPNGAHHVMILVGVVGYYASAPGAQNALARPVVARLRKELSPLMSPTLAVMRTWRSTRRRARLVETKGDGKSYHESPSERGTVESSRC